MILKLPVVYVNLIVDELFFRHEHPHDYVDMDRPRTCGFLDMGKKKTIVINLFTYDNQKICSVYLPRLSTMLSLLSKLENDNEN